MNKDLKKFLAQPAPKGGSRCRVCADPRVANDLADWAKARAAGGGHALNGFYEGYLLAAYKNPPSRGSVRNHVVNCLKLDVTTGRPLHDEKEQG